MATKAGAVSRNDPCPCGSGQKHKKCCLGKKTSTAKDLRVPAVIALVGLVGGGLGWWLADLRVGGAIAAVGLLVAAAWAVFKDPPPPRKGGNAAGLDFGM